MQHFSRRQTLGFMVICLLLAAAFRLVDLPAVPPGLHYDEAANGTLAADIAFRGSRPLFIPSYTGKEVLFFYLAGGVMRAIGQSVLALRLTAGFVGLLTIAAAYRLGWELFGDRRVAAIAAALISVSFWHLVFSRLGFRAITQPLLQALAMAALFRGLRRQESSWLVLGGIFMGLVAYTYLAARVFPILVILALLPLIAGRREFRQHWWQLLLFGVMSLAVVAPLAWYFAGNPDAFWIRIRQVSPEVNGSELNLGESYLKSLQMLFLAGDPYWRFNIPGRPLFDWFWGGMLVFGWGTLIVSWRRARHYWRRAAILLLTLCPLIMVLPTALATREILPSNLRAIGLAPFLFYLPAYGLVSLLSNWARRLRIATVSQAWLVVGLLVVAIGGFTTYRAYFQSWVAQPALFYESDGDLAAVATFLDEPEVEGAAIFVSALHYRHPTLAFLSRRYDDIKWLPNSQALVFPAEGPAIYVYPHNSPVPGWAQSYFESARRTDGFNASSGLPTYTAFRLDEVPEFTIPNPVNINFGDTITLLGYEVNQHASGLKIPVRLFWRVQRPPVADFMPFLHLQDPWLARWSQVETFAYPAEQWQPDDIIIQQAEVPIRPGTPPGRYRILVGLFSPSTGERLPRFDAENRYAGDAIIIENVPVVAVPPTSSLPEPPLALDEQVRQGLRLLGYSRGQEEVNTGEVLPLALWWHATSAQPQLTTRLELMRPDNTGYILINTSPVHGSYPFQRWQTPQFVIDRVDPLVPDNFPAGEYRLFLRLLDERDRSLYTADLGPLTVRATERLFKAPPISHPLAAVFGGEIALLGYDLKPAASPEQFTLSLVWQARTQPETDYTVFVHLLRLDGTCCLWQQDVMPRQSEYPTSRWLANEVVADSYQIVIPAGTAGGRYALEVGLYIAETGRRLQAVQPGLDASDAVILLPLTIK